jgi:hypothetical protein
MQTPRPISKLLIVLYTCDTNRLHRNTLHKMCHPMGYSSKNTHKLKLQKICIFIRPEYQSLLHTGLM